MVVDEVEEEVEEGSGRETEEEVDEVVVVMESEVRKRLVGFG